MTRKQKQKERRTLNHIFNTCVKHGLTFQWHNYGYDAVEVQCYNFEKGSFMFNEKSGKYDLSINELRSRVDQFIKERKNG